MHELRTPTSKLPRSSDPEEQRLREIWYARRKEWEIAGFPDSGIALQGFTYVDEQLTKYIWDRAVALREADRKAHPKAKRNLPPPPKDPADITSRYLP